MKLIGSTLVLSILLATGCASRGTRAGDASDEATPAAGKRALAFNAADDDALGKRDAEETPIMADESDPRAVGDYVTYSFSGSFRKTPLRLTQRVVARTDETITIDYTFIEGTKSETLRVTRDAAGTNRGETASVERVREDGSLAKATTADFDAKMNATLATADENEALLDQSQTTVRVGESDLTATRSTYKVRVGAKSATLETTESNGFVWGDLGGKIVTADGKVVYHAEVVDAGGPSSARASLE